MKTYLYLILAAFLLNGLLSTSLQAQYNATGWIAQPDELSSFRYLPGRLNLGEKTFAVSFANPYFYVGQNMAGIGDAMKLFDGKLSAAERKQEWRNMAGELKSTNRVGALAEAFPLAIAFRLGKDSPITFVATTEVKAGMALTFNDNMGRLIMTGNKGFEGQTVDLGDKLRFRAMALQAFGAGINWQVIGEPGDALSLSVGGQLKFLQGYLGADLEMNQASLYTSEPLMRWEYDYTMHTAGLDNRYEDSRGISGSGIGADLGATLGLGENIEISASLTQLGAIRFTKNITNYRGRDAFDWEGVESNEFLDFDSYNVDSIFDRLKPTESYSGDFTLNIGPKALVHAVYRIPASGSNDFDRHRIGLSWVQGLSQGPFTTTMPYVVGSYVFRPVGALGIGGSAGWGGFSGISFGLLLAVDAGPFRMGFGTQHILGGLLSSGTATDLNLSFDFVF